MNDERGARFGAGMPSDGDPAPGPLDEVEILGIEAVDEEEADGFEPAVEAEEPPVVASPRPAPEARVPPGEDLATLRDRHLRLLADFDNFRKRAEREREERVRYALADPIRELLPVFDNLDRALAAKGGIEDLRLGVEMIARQFEEVLKRFGVTVVPAVGERFDPRMHEAVMRVESDEVETPTVVEQMQRGYRLHDRLLRPAMVRVAVPAEHGHAEEAAPADSPAPEGTGDDE